MRNQISILGCGWLGFPLAEFLIKKGYAIKGSTTNLDKMSILENNKIQAFQIEIFEQEVKGAIASFLEQSEIVILNIPPKLRKFSEENYVKKIETILPFIEKYKIKEVIFISSTSVYGETNEIITELTKPNPETESGIQLIKAEALLKSNPNFKTTVIRFGGLIGDNRHPIFSLSGKQNIKNPEAPINLIHLTDCINIIATIIQKPTLENLERGATFNAVAPFHPTRLEYYTKKANLLNLVIPEFETGKKSIGKTIISDKLITELHYNFIHQSL